MIMSTKKILLGATAFYLICTASAYAQVGVSLNIGEPVYPAYVAPAPVYVSPYPEYYDPRHRQHDWAYWHNRGHSPERGGDRGHR